MRILQLEWNEWNEDHSARHEVEPPEVEEVVARGDDHMVRTRSGRYGVLGQTDAGRYLYIVVERTWDRVFFVVTAREADSKERRQYIRHRNRA